MPFTRAAIMAPSPNPSYVHTHLTSQCKSVTPSMFTYCRPPCTTQYTRNVEPWLLSTYLCAHAALAPCASRSLHKSSVKTLLSASYHPTVSTWWAICLWDMQIWKKMEVVNSSSGDTIIITLAPGTPLPVEVAIGCTRSAVECAADCHLLLPGGETSALIYSPKNCVQSKYTSIYLVYIWNKLLTFPAPTEWIQCIENEPGHWRAG